MKTGHIAVLFARSDSVYKTMAKADVWDIDRDARKWPGGCPVVAHPPCRAWGRLSHMAKPRNDEYDLAIYSINQVRANGGVLEHPAGSKLWGVANLPAPGYRDSLGGFTMPIRQSWFGHLAPKNTWLYIVGVAPKNIPAFPYILGQPEGRIENMSKASREKTPVDLALWLLDLAQRCGQ